MSSVRSHRLERKRIVILLRPPFQVSLRPSVSFGYGELGGYMASTGMDLMNERGRTRPVLIAVLVVVVIGTVALLRRPPGDSGGRSSPEPAARPALAPSKKRPVLWVLAVGVSRYRDEKLALRFASADASALAGTLARQSGGPLYDEVRTRVLLDEQASRARILEALEEFLGQAAPIDVGVIYLAGHGVHEPGRDAYYFLPAGAVPEKAHIEGVDVADLGRQLRLLHRNLRQLVVIMDTCHAGALAADRARLGQDLAARLAPAEGLYILAAARSGEQSVELPDVGHGAFTQALLDGLAGAAANPDGLITVFGLAGHATRLVGQLTNGEQHPYQAIVGEDLVLAAHPARFAQVTPPPLPEPVRVGAPLVRERLAVMSFENLRPNPRHDWMEKALRQELTTALAAVGAFDVYEEVEVRFLAREATDPLEAVSRAGMAKLVDGTYWVEDDRITITASVKNIRPLQRVASARIDGRLEQFFDLRGRIVLDLLEQLQVEVPADVIARVVDSSSTDLAARKLLFDAEQSGGQPAARPTPDPTPGSGASLRGGVLGWFLIAAPSHAAETADVETELRSTMDSYRAAFEAKDMDALRRHYADFNAGQEAALKRYFENADGLTVEFSNVRITIIEDRASVSFTRQDRFVDHQTGESQRVVVRVTKLLARGSGGWQIVPEP